MCDHGRSAIQRLKDMADLVGRICMVIAGCCMVSMVVLVTINIIVRRAPFDSPIVGSAEISTFLSAMLISFALPINQLRKGNIGVELVTSLLPSPIRRGMERVVLLISAVLCVLIGWQLFEYAVSMYEGQEVSMTLRIPFFPIIAIAGVCFGMLAFVLIVQAATGSDGGEQ